MNAIELFFLLQVLDFMTTLAGLRMGGVEMSPFARWLIEIDTVGGLTLVKLIGVVLGGYCVWSRRLNVIHWVNYVFAAIVVWNVYQILKAASTIG